MHYLDHAATTPVSQEVAQTMVSVLTENFGNPSAQYALGRKAKDLTDRSRGVIAGALGARPEQIFFTSCGTEGDNWAIRAALHQNRRVGKHIVTTAVEHSAVLQCVKHLEQEGYAVTYVKPDGEGRISAEAVLETVREDTAVVSVMLVNNETGAVFPVAEIAEGVKNKPALLHTDAVQGFLKIPFTAKSLGADYITLSAHKIGGPKGIGALYVGGRAKNTLPLLFGGGQESGLRPGTEATAQIAGFAAAARAAAADGSRLERAAAVKEYTLTALKAALPKLEVISAGDAPHICAVTLPGYKSEVIVRVLGDRGVCVSSGSACHKGRPSHVFAAMGLPKPWLDGALRLSFSPDSTKEEADALVSALKDAAGRLFTTLS